jgi:putative transcriptional regulator
MSEMENYQGQLLVAQPKCVTNFFARSTILIVRHTDQGAWGVITNRVFNKMESGLEVVMNQTGIDYVSEHNEPLYVGGPVETNRIHVVHSMDWSSASTIMITSDLGVTSDVSVLAAIAGGQGPEHFRVAVGMCGWGPGQLEGEMVGMPPWLPEHRWLHAPATLANVFDFDESFQWQNAIQEAAKETTKAWF